MSGITSSMALEMIRPFAARLADNCERLWPGDGIVIYDGERTRHLSRRAYEAWARNVAIRIAEEGVD